MMQASPELAIKLMDELIGDIAKMLGCEQDSDEIICAIEQLKEGRDTALREMDEARAVLRFYADPDNWDASLYADGVPIAILEAGDRARAFLGWKAAPSPSPTTEPVD